MAQIAIVTDEISQDFESAVVLGLEWGIRNFEIRSVNMHRVPDFSETERRVIFDVVKTLGVRVTALSPGLFKIPLDAQLANAHLEQRLSQSIELAHELGTDKLIVFGFVRPKHVTATEYPQQIIDFLGAAAQKAAGEGVVLALENEPICWADTGKTTAQILGAVGAENLGINWDPCNAMWSGETLPYPKGYEQVRPYMNHLHIKDARRDSAGKWEHTIIGEGNIDWTGQIDALLQDGFKGPLTIETHFGPGVKTSKACAQALKRILSDLGGSET